MGNDTFVTLEEQQGSGPSIPYELQITPLKSNIA